MNGTISRRDLFRFLGGSTAGLLLTPVPWKLIDDLAIWTQNWPWVPTPRHGEIRTKFTTCTLCPAGCGVRARCVGDQPFSLMGAPQHPLSHGALCPLGLTGHQLPYHPARLFGPVQVVRSGGAVDLRPVSLADALKTIAQAITETAGSESGESVAILDEQPGRAISHLYRQFLAGVPQGLYGAAAVDDSLVALQEMMEKPFGPLGYDLENARTVLSFGAPLLEGWGIPGRMMSLMKSGDATRPGKRQKLIQVETRQSHTAALADEWIPIKPGAEAAVALGLAHVLIREKRFDSAVTRGAIDFQSTASSSYRKWIERFTPEQVSAVSGVPPEKLAGLAGELADRAPTVVIGGEGCGSGPLGREEEMAIAGLNLLLGSVGKRGGVVKRRALPTNAAEDEKPVAAITSLSQIPDHSIRVLILDAAGSGRDIPWPLVEKKLVPGRSLLVSLAPYFTGKTQNVDYVIPAPTFLETYQDMPAPADAPRASFSLAVPLLSPPGGATEPMDFIRRLADATGNPLSSWLAGQNAVDVMKRRAESIFKTRRGQLFTSSDGKSVDIASLTSAAQLWKALCEGGCWIDDALAQPPLPRFRMFGRAQGELERMTAVGEGRLKSMSAMATAFPLILMPFREGNAEEGGRVSPLMTKLYQESGLRCLANQAFIHPDTARANGLSDEREAWIETAAGAIQVEVHFDVAVMPDVVHVSTGPARENFLSKSLRAPENAGSICWSDDGATWRMTRARIREA